MKSPSDVLQPYGSSRLRLLGRLQQGPAWTLDLRREPHRWSANPAARVQELREAGHDIRTIRVWADDLSDYYDCYVLGINGVPVVGKAWPYITKAIRAKWGKQP